MLLEIPLFKISVIICKPNLSSMSDIQIPNHFILMLLHVFC